MAYNRTGGGAGNVRQQHREQQTGRLQASPPQQYSGSHTRQNQGNGSPSPKRARGDSRSKQPGHQTEPRLPSASPSLGSRGRSASKQKKNEGSSSSKKARGDSRSREPEQQAWQCQPSPSFPRMLPHREQEPQCRLQGGVSYLPHQNLTNLQQWAEPAMEKPEMEIKRYEKDRALMQRQIDDLQEDLKKSQQDYMNLRDSHEVERTRLAKDTMSENRRLQEQIKEERKRHEREIQSERKRSQDAIEAEKIRSAQEAQSYKLSLREEMKVEKTRLAKDTMSENRRLQEQIEGLKEENKILKSKNQDLLQRISSMASDRMRSNNPCVEDLSDPHRHSAVLGKWQALMNGEYWTLYEVALKQLPDEKNTAHFLLRIMELGFKEAQYLQNGSKAFMDLMQNQRTAQRDPSIATLIDSLMKNESFQQIVDSESRKVRKGSNATLSAADFQNFHTKILRESGNARRELLDRSHKFADEVLRLCFLMALQSPPMALVFDRPEDKEMDALLYEPDGDKNRRRPWKVKFVLTPPLLRHEGGPVLCKGTVEIS